MIYRATVVATIGALLWLGCCRSNGSGRRWTSCGSALDPARTDRSPRALHVRADGGCGVSSGDYHIFYRAEGSRVDEFAVSPGWMAALTRRLTAESRAVDTSGKAIVAYGAATAAHTDGRQLALSTETSSRSTWVLQNIPTAAGR